MTKHECHPFKLSTDNPLSSVWMIFELYDPQFSLVWASLYLHSQFNSSASSLSNSPLYCMSPCSGANYYLSSEFCLLIFNLSLSFSAFSYVFEKQFSYST